MERGPVWRVLLALSVLDMGSGGSGGAYYEVHMEQVSFDKAAEGCSGGGAGGLAELSTQQEVSEALRRVTDELQGSAGPQAFWVGLRKTKRQCVDPNLPLRGFRWQSDDGERWEGPGRWWKEPELTCTTGRCAALQAQAPGPGPARWGLLALPCKDELPFICQRTHGHAEPPPTNTAPGETKPPTTHTLVVTTTPSSTLASSTLTSSTTTHRAGPGPVSDPKPGSNPKPGAEPVPEPAMVPGTKPCHNPTIPGTRWLEPDPDDPGVLRVECWSGAQPKLHCSDGHWEINGSVLDPASVCSGSRTTTPPPPPPPPPPSPSGASQAGVEDAWAGLMIPVLVAVAVLVVLVVVAVVLVRCCLVRRSKDRAVRKAEKMAMKNQEAGGKDFMETTNEKERR